MYLTTEGNPLRKMEEAGAWDAVYDLPNLRQHDCEDLYEDGEEEEEEEKEAEEAGAAGAVGGDRVNALDTSRGDAGGEMDEAGAEVAGGSAAAIEAEELLDIVHEMGRRRLAAAAKVFEDSMALLRDNRARVLQVCVCCMCFARINFQECVCCEPGPYVVVVCVMYYLQAQQSELVRDREQQEEMYKKAKGELQEMKAREDAHAEADRAKLAAQMQRAREELQRLEGVPNAGISEQDGDDAAAGPRAPASDPPQGSRVSRRAPAAEVHGAMEGRGGASGGMEAGAGDQALATAALRAHPGEAITALDQGDVLKDYVEKVDVE
jgi:hypothetical protein